MSIRSRRFSTSLKVVLILIGAILLGYFAKLFTGKKQAVFADTVAVIHPPKKHSRKHRFKIHRLKIAKVTKADTLIVPPRIIAPKTQQIKPAALITKVSPVKPTVDSLIHKQLFLYTTYVQPNVTGVVKLRRQDNFYADIIADIPAKSQVRVLKKGPMYYQVAYNNTIGFVPKWALQVQ